MSNYGCNDLSDYLSGLQNAVDVVERQFAGVLRRVEKQQISEAEERKQNQRRLGGFPATHRQTDRQTDAEYKVCCRQCGNEIVHFVRPVAE